MFHFVRLSRVFQTLLEKLKILDYTVPIESDIVISLKFDQQILVNKEDLVT